ncbi:MULTISPECIES: M56 family metallopeptidase [unclassified Mucilaginibacter]|uniref:M56 family metallopeptidase n=1 Tax=unclassified Mucilaginibacter TaxID=2617802 RepID=UPI002AC966B6|nr:MULTISPECIES: M56 family metallopeptidase [unclassified Mucilaginibacter]MEB0263582.1 M56 family metallopeptidase [Mucilaginibacter sp. 10I4]MEB0280744.1 M56 family metallopeptidase [Mucilaginibacter sp. 10B2]MEB0301461.1 M56 family metallopeptidase [Mucilaginibacter sp. 5C4]WPX22667.1 M56 family metallopeptidase [Mucilaginibacter sp. 5C4]
MIAYLIKSALCLVVLLAAYHLLLEKEKMHRFNRFLLLISLVFSLFVPAITIQLPQASVPTILPITYVINEGIPQQIHTETQSVQVQNIVVAHSLTITDYLLIVYSIGITILLIRFADNLLSIYKTIRRNKNIPIEYATLVLVPEEVIPHSFFNYIFVNESDYENPLETQLLQHELTHVLQRHSLDILFIELLKIAFWFNPIFILYKRAIQLNHEFLADENVLSAGDDLQGYQYLLLSKAGLNPAINLTSNFNYSITKKRLMMMTHTTPKLRAMLKGIALAPVITALVFFLSTKPETATAKSALPVVDTVPQKAQVQFPKPTGKGPYISRRGNDGKAVFYKYVADLTPAEKKKFKFQAPGSFTKPEKQSPNERQLQSWTTKSIYGIWVDGKHVTNDALASYTTKDIVYYTSSPLTKYAINYPKNFFQIDLYTEDGYKKAFKTWKDRKNK